MEAFALEFNKFLKRGFTKHELRDYQYLMEKNHGVDRYNVSAEILDAFDYVFNKGNKSFDLNDVVRSFVSADFHSFVMDSLADLGIPYSVRKHVVIEDYFEDEMSDYSKYDTFVFQNDYKVAFEFDFTDGQTPAVIVDGKRSELTELTENEVRFGNHLFEVGKRLPTGEYFIVGDFLDNKPTLCKYKPETNADFDKISITANAMNKLGLSEARFNSDAVISAPSKRSLSGFNFEVQVNKLPWGDLDLNLVAHHKHLTESIYMNIKDLSRFE